MAPKYSEKTQTGCLILFCAPFCIGGLIALIAAARLALAPSPNWLSVFALTAFGVTFALAGLAFFQMGLKS